MSQDSVGCGNQNVTELTRRQKIDNPLFDFINRNIETRADHSALIQSTRQINDNLVGPVIINDFEFSNVS